MSQTHNYKLYFKRHFKPPQRIIPFQLLYIPSIISMKCCSFLKKILKQKEMNDQKGYNNYFLMRIVQALETLVETKYYTYNKLKIHYFLKMDFSAF